MDQETVDRETVGVVDAAREYRLALSELRSAEKAEKETAAAWNSACERGREARDRLMRAQRMLVWEGWLCRSFDPPRRREP